MFTLAASEQPKGKAQNGRRPQEKSRNAKKVVDRVVSLAVKSFSRSKQGQRGLAVSNTGLKLWFRKEHAH
jgi:hypothetical protein